MEYRCLGRSGIAVSRLGLGCVTFGREIDEPAAFALADRAFEAGITLFDTADVYGGGASETVLGKWLHARGNREKIVICTKVGGPLPDDPSDRGCSAARIQRQIDASLRRLQVEYVDFYLTHCWDFGVPPQETLHVLDAMVQAGKARAIGCSNYAGWQLCRMLWLAEVGGLARMETVQAPLSLVLGRREMEKELGPLCADQEVGFMSYSPLGAGFLTGKYGRGDMIPAGSRFDVIPGHQPLYFSPANYDLVEGLRRHADAIGASLPELAIGWVLQQSRVATTLVGARTPAQVEQALAAWEFSRRYTIPSDLTMLPA